MPISYTHLGDYHAPCHICGASFTHKHADKTKPEEFTMIPDDELKRAEGVIGVNVSGTESVTADIKPFYGRPENGPDWFDKYGHWSDFGYRVFFTGDIRKILQENTERTSNALKSLKRHPRTALETRSLKLKARNEAFDEAIKIISEI